MCLYLHRFLFYRCCNFTKKFLKTLKKFHEILPHWISFLLMKKHFWTTIFFFQFSSSFVQFKELYEDINNVCWKIQFLHDGKVELNFLGFFSLLLDFVTLTSFFWCIFYLSHLVSITVPWLYTIVMR